MKHIRLNFLYRNKGLLATVTALCLPVALEAGPYSPGKGGATEAGFTDAGVAGFVGTAGEGVAASDSNDNYVNPVFQGWASGYTLYDPSDNVGTYGQNGIGSQFADPTLALGPVTGNNMDTVSMGDMDSTEIADHVADPSTHPLGTLILTFDDPISNGAGADFAAFENGFVSNYNTGAGSVAGMMFAELGYVEVSTNGVDYVRFPSSYLNDTPTGSTAYLTQDVSNIYNLVGKHANAYGESWGTPFDLSDLESHADVIAGKVDLNNINYVKIVDIPGDGTFEDANGNGIYDAWVTWGSGGLDFEALGVMNYAGETLLAGWDSEADGDTRAFVESNVTLIEGETVGALQFAGSYQIDGESITLGAGNRGVIISDPEYMATISSDLQGSDGLVKTGAGTLVFDGAKSYTGETVISAGALRGSADSLGRDITNHSRVEMLVSGEQSFDNVISGTGDFISEGGVGSVLTLTAQQTYTGDTEVSGGTLRAGVAQSISSDSHLYVNEGASFDLDGYAHQVRGLSGQGSISLGESSGALTLGATAASDFGGVIAGTGDVINAGSSIQTLSGNNTFVGTVQLDGGQLAVSSENNLGDAANAIQFSGGTLRIEGTSMSSTSRTLSVDPAGELKIAVADAGHTFELGGGLSGDRAIGSHGSGTLRLLGANTHTGGVNIASGTVEIDSQSQLGSGTLQFNGGTLKISGGGFVNLSVPVSGSQFNLDIADSGHTYSVGTEFDGSGTLRKYGDGTMVLTSSSTRTGYNYAYAGTLDIQSSSAASGRLYTYGTSTTILRDHVGIGGYVYLREDSTLVMQDGATITNRFYMYNDAKVDLQDGSVISGNMYLYGGTVGGSGTLATDASFRSGSTIAPGHSVGTLYIEDAELTLQDGSTYDFEIDSSGSDLVEGVGTMDILTLEEEGILNIATLDHSSPYHTDWTLFSGFESIIGSMENWEVWLNGNLVSPLNITYWQDGGDYGFNVVPEPSMAALWTGLLALVYLSGRRRVYARTDCK